MDETKPSKTARPRRVWLALRIFAALLFAAILTLVILIAFTDVLQRAAFSYAQSKVEKGGGSLTASHVGGGIRGPLLVKDLVFEEGAENATRIAASEISVGLRIMPWLKGDANLVGDVRVIEPEIRFVEQPESDEPKKPSEPVNPQELLKSIADWIPSSLVIQDLSAEILQRNGGRIEVGSLNLSVDQSVLGSVNIDGMTITNPEGETAELPPLQGRIALAGKELELAGWDFGDFAVIESASLDLEELQEGRVSASLVWQAFGGSGDGRFTVEGKHVTANFNAAEIHLDAVADLLPDAPSLTGRVASMDVSFSGNPKLTSTIVASVNGSLRDLAWSETQAGDLDFTAELRKGKLKVEPVTWQYQDAAFSLAAAGSMPEKFKDWMQGSYTVRADFENTQLSAFEPLAALAGADFQGIDGRLTTSPVIQWNDGSLEFSGPIQLAEATQNGEPLGDIALDARASTSENFEAGTVQLDSATWQHADGIVNANGTGSWSSDASPVLQLSISAVRDTLSFAAQAELAEERLELSEIRILKGDALWLTGSAGLAVRLGAGEDALAGLIPWSEPIDASLNAKTLAVREVASLIGMDVPVDAIVTAGLVVEGTAEDPTLNLTLDATQIALRDAGDINLAESSASVTAQFSDGRLTTNGTAQYPGAGNITWDGSVPMDLAAASRGEGELLSKTMPLTASLRLTETNLAILQQISPGLPAIIGVVSSDVSVAGTVSDPELSGSVSVRDVRIPISEGYPAIEGLNLTATFSGNSAQINEGRGTVASAVFEISGGVQFEDLANPVLAVELTGERLLLVRNDAMRLRADVDLTLTGPLDSAELAGSVRLVDGLYMRNISFNPLQLTVGGDTPRRTPIRSIPQPFEFTDPPLSNWTFNVAIYNETPFRIQSNFIRSVVVPDIQLVGTGKDPYLAGNVQFFDAALVLPFSRAKVLRGGIYFDEMQPRLPFLDLHARSQVREYQIDLYVYGRMNDPQILMISVPPLPEEDIGVLLSTGLTPAELQGDEGGRAAIGRGGILLFQSLFQNRDDLLDDDDDFFNRISINILPPKQRGSADIIETKFELTDRWSITAERDSWGFFNAGVEYRFRFR